MDLQNLKLQACLPLLNLKRNLKITTPLNSQNDCIRPRQAVDATYSTKPLIKELYLPDYDLRLVVSDTKNPNITLKEI